MLHGGSGTPDEMLRKAIELGIRKINVATELRMAYMEGLEASVGQRDFYKMCKQAKDNITAVALPEDPFVPGTVTVKLFHFSAVCTKYKPTILQIRVFTSNNHCVMIVSSIRNH